MIRHLTENEICRAIAGQSTLDEQEHALSCAECRSEIARSQQLITTLRHGIAQQAERDLVFTTAAMRRHAHVRRFVPAAAVALAGIMAFAAAVVWQHRPQATTGASSRVVSRPAAVSGHAGTPMFLDGTNEFYALQYSTVPIGEGRIVRIEVPRSAPVAFGLDPVEFVSARRGAVLADVIVGEDGLARAVRFVRPVTGAARE
jgi:hypothetical protein